MHGILDDNGNILASFVVPMTLVSKKQSIVSDTLSMKRIGSRQAGQRWELETKLFPLNTDANGLFAHMVDKGYTEKFNIIVPQNTGSVANRIILREVGLTVFSGTGTVPFIVSSIVRFGADGPICTVIHIDGANYYVSPSVAMALSGVSVYEYIMGSWVIVSDVVASITPTQLWPVIASAPAGTDTITASLPAAQAADEFLIPAGTMFTVGTNKKLYMAVEDSTAGVPFKIHPNLQSSVTDEPIVYGDTVKMQCFYDTTVISGMQYSDGILMDNGSVKLIEAL